MQEIGNRLRLPPALRGITEPDKRRVLEALLSAGTGISGPVLAEKTGDTPVRVADALVVLRDGGLVRSELKERLLFFATAEAVELLRPPEL